MSLSLVQTQPFNQQNTQHTSFQAYTKHSFIHTFQFYHYGGIFVKVREGNMFYLTACLLDF